MNYRNGKLTRDHMTDLVTYPACDTYIVYYCSSLANGISMTSASRADNSGPIEATVLYAT